MAGRAPNVAFTVLKVAGQVCLERIARPMARGPEDVPRSVYAITPEWLTAVLCQAHPGSVVTPVAVEPASAGTHERHRLRLTYKPAGTPAPLPPAIFTQS